MWLALKKNGGSLLFQLYWCGGPWPESPQVLFVSVDLNAGDMIIDVCMTENNYERQYAWLFHLFFLNLTCSCPYSYNLINVINSNLHVCHFQQYFSYIMATSFSGGGSRREPPTMGEQLVSFVICGCELLFTFRSTTSQSN
jgi:hypothetical protein